MCTKVPQVCATAEHNITNQPQSWSELAGIPLTAFLLVAKGTLKPRHEKIHHALLLS